MKYQIEGETLSNIADAIREKAGTVEGIAPENMDDAVRSIPSGTSVTITMNDNPDGGVDLTINDTTRTLAEEADIDEIKADLTKLSDDLSVVKNEGGEPHIVTGKNLADPSKFVQDRRADSDTTVRTGEVTTGWCDLKGNTNAYVIFNATTTIAVRIAYKNQDGTIALIQSTAINVTKEGYAFEVPFDAVSVRVSCNSTNMAKGIMVALGSTIEPFEAYYEREEGGEKAPSGYVWTATTTGAEWKEAQGGDLPSEVSFANTTFGSIKANGKNLIGETESGIYNGELDGSGTGLPQTGNSYLRTKNYISVAYGDKLTFSVDGVLGKGSSQLRSLVTYDKDFNVVRAYMAYPNPFTINKNEHYVRIAYGATLVNPMLEYGEEISAYEPFNGGETIDPNKNSVRYPKEDEDVMQNPWYGKKMVVDGDSITHDQGRFDYWQFVAANLLGMHLDTSNRATYASGWKGVGGSRIANDPVDSTDDPMYNIVLRYMDYPSDADIVIIAGGTNDWAHGNVALGDFDSTDVHTFNGALNTLLPGLKEKYPNIPIVMMTPIKRGAYGSYGANTPQSHLQLTQEQFVDAMIAKCRQYNVHCLDMWANCPINPNIESMADSLYNRNIDLVHPNVNGHKVMGKTVAGFIRSIG